MITVKAAKHIREYQILVKFSDGVELSVDLRNALDGEVFQPLRNVKTFRAFSLDPVLETIVWENGADFAPEFLYKLGQDQLKQRA